MSRPPLPHRSLRSRRLVLSAGLAATLVAMACAGTAGAAQPLVTGVDATFAPHAMPKLGGGLQGFNIDLGEALAKQLGTTIKIEGTEYAALIPGLNARKYDFVLAPTTATPERAKSLLFSEGYLNTDYTFLIAKNKPDITGLQDLKGKTLAVNKGSAYENWARDNAAQYGFKYDVYASNADAVQAVQSGRADANLAGNTVSAWAAKQNPAVKTSYTLRTGLVWALAFRLDDKAGRDRVSTALKCLKQNGTVSALAQKWFGFTPAPGSAAATVGAGQGVPELDGYDATPVKLQC
ncbi:transporter substrate-binding domain-containing protein [Bordetella flabilis]|uniref:Polar amino acid ABC transporter substrate-binding protein n=1 Tax=Bordetella flabilis TaxID=463014 RepID=A0A193GHD3_9BORD|nr:transporter substrate-binding domain-containing protein [Bordetella flabilis]ANN79477.1 polar amino acid ABC transporter substrate-binding protein [Bordetella flabilis]